MFGVLTFRHPMIADMSLLRHILRAFVCHFISECSGGHNSSTVKLQNLQRNYSGLKRNKIFAFLPSAHVQVPESSRRAGSYFSMTPSWTSPCGHVAWLRPDTGTLVLVLVMVLPRAHEKPPYPSPPTPHPLLSACQPVYNVSAKMRQQCIKILGPGRWRFLCV